MQAQDRDSVGPPVYSNLFLADTDNDMRISVGHEYPFDKLKKGECLLSEDTRTDGYA